MNDKQYNEIKSILLEHGNMLKKLTAGQEKERLTPAEVQKMLGIGKSTYQRYMNADLFKQIKIKGKAYVERSEINKLIEEGKI